MSQYKTVDLVPNGFRQLEGVDGVFVDALGHVVITGSPMTNDSAHNCDAMGCSSVSHVLIRATAREGSLLPHSD